ncbi:MAG: hypothetical protein HC861_03290 [Rhodospirillaceae bacterium]|nr:hypothetical protein [Rhodospirillaceae bacterium]
MVIAALLWSIESLVCELLRLIYPKRVITVHYEDLCGQPIALLERLETFTGLSLAGAKAAAAERRVMQPRYALSANRLMRGEQIAFLRPGRDHAPPDPVRQGDRRHLHLSHGDRLRLFRPPRPETVGRDAAAAAVARDS